MTEQPEFDAPLADEAPEVAPAEETPSDVVASSDETAEGGAAEAPVRPREVIKGIHPALLCTCEECAPEFTELQWFSPEEQRKTKGQVMLFCARSGLKYFSQAVELNAWIAANPVAKASRRGKEAS